MDLHQNNKTILNQQLQLLYASLPFSIVASLFNGAILIYIQRSVVSHDVLTIWMMSLIVVMIFRGIIFFLYKKSDPAHVVGIRWSYLNRLGLLMAAIVWGAASIFLFPFQSVAHQAFLGFVIAGMSAGAISTLSSSKNSMLLFTSFLLLPLSFQFFRVGTEFGVAMGSMVLLYYFIISSVAIKNYQNSMQNMKLNVRAEEQQNALKQSEEKYQTIFESAPLGILHYSPQGEVTSMNSMALDLIEIRDESLRQINLLHDVQDSEFILAIEHSLQGELGNYKGSTNAIFAYSDKPIRMYCRGTYDNSGQISGGVAILEDITEENRLNLLKNEFVSTVSHELRTPLTAIHGATGLLKNAKDSITSEQFDSLISNIMRNSERLTQLVNDILDVEKITTGKMDFRFEKIKLSELLIQSVDDNQAYAEKYHVSIVLQDFPGNLLLMVDKNRFQQIMANLLSNAAKFSDEGSKVQVGAEIIDSNKVRIFVKDKGQGIAADFQEKIFDKFTQQDSSDIRKVGGTGLGLTISKEIVQKMNGQLNFSTEQGKGSTFYFDMPIIK